MRTLYLICCFLVVFDTNSQFTSGNIELTGSEVVHKRFTYPTPPKTKNSLFYIQRSNNSSAIVYDGIRDESGNLDPKNPVHVYWLSYSQDSTMNELNYIQRKLAYGVNVRETENEHEFDISLVSYKKRRIKIFKNEKGEMQANMEINGRVARFRNVYVEIEKNLFIPEIAYVEIFGEDLKTGEQVYEKIIP